jgi:predicted aconitase
MNLTDEERRILNDDSAPSLRKAMEILTALGNIYEAERLIPVSSVQISGVSYDNLGEAGLEFLAKMADGGGRTQVFTTLNPAGMDIEAPQSLGISPNFAERQRKVIDAFARMGVVTTCTCTPYLVGSLPHFGEHIAWAESSAVCFANSVLGARTNREGGPSALAAALTGLTAAYGYHLAENRHPTITFSVETGLVGTQEFGALGIVIGSFLEKNGVKPLPFIRGITGASLEELKSLCASLATFGGAALFHIEGITPEASLYEAPERLVSVRRQDIDSAIKSLFDLAESLAISALRPDLYSLGCPHLSLNEIAQVARLLEGKQVKKELWITTARPTRDAAQRMGYIAIIEAAGAIIAADTCCVVAPIEGRFGTLVTDSAKACYYAASKHRFKTRFLPFEQVIAEALE